ncbi:putative reverse transcriptase domain-containing protein, partial [Tanacetum coccineum]
MYNFWKGRMELYIKGKENGRMILDSVLKGPLVYGTIKVECVTRTKTYEELSDKEKHQDDCDIRATNIVLQGTKLSQQERECKLYNEFDRFTSAKVPHHQQQYQTPISHLTPSVSQHAYQASVILQQSQAEFPQLDLGLAVPSFLPGDDPIASLNKAMTFLSTTIALRYPTTNNQLRTSFNPINQATIQDGRVLDEEQLAFLSDPGVAEGQDTQTTMPHNAALQTDDLDAFVSDYDEAPLARAVLMANLSSYDSYVISEKCFEIQKKELLLENDRLLELIISQDLVHTAVNSLAAIDYQNMEKSYVDEYTECVTLKPEHSKKNEIVEKVIYNELSNKYSQLEQHCISLEIAMQQSQERVINSTSTSGSQSKSNTRKNRITQAANSNKKNKTVEVHPRSVMSSLNKKNRVSMCNANTKHAVIDANSKFVMAIYVISVSSNSLEDSVGTLAGRVILFGTIPTTIPDTTPSMIPPTIYIDTTPIPTISPTIPSSPDYTPASPDYSPASDTEIDPSEDPSSDHIPPLPSTSPFLSSTDDSSDSDIPDTPPSPTYDTPFTDTTLSTHRSPTTSGALRRRVIVLVPGQTIPHGRPYRYHLNGPVHIMTARKRVEPMPTHHLTVRHSVDYSSSDHFSLDDSSRDSSSSSSSKSSSDSSMDTLSDSVSSRSSSDHSLPTSSSGMRPNHHLCSLVPSVHRSSAIFERPSHYSSSMSLSRKRSRSPVAYVPLSLPTLGALSYARTDLLPSPKRIRSPEIATNLEGCSKDSFEPYVPREARLGVDFEDESSEPSRSKVTDLEIDVDVKRSNGIEIDPEVQAEIDECFAYADALRDRGIDARVGAVEVTYETLGDLVQRFHDHTKEIPVHHVQLERDNRRLRNIVDVESQRVTRFWHSELRVQRELRQIRCFRFYDRMRIARLEACARRASRIREGVNEQSNRRMAEALRVRDAVRNLGPLMGDEGEQEINGNGGNGNRVNRNGGNGNGGNENGRNGGNGNRGNGNGGNRNGGNGNVMEMEENMAITSEDLCLLKRVVGLTYWFEKMETVFHISNCPEKYQVKYAMCTLLNNALTWCNSHKRVIRIKAAYAMSWVELMKLMTEVYYHKNEVQTMETELWNLVVKGNDLTAYTRRFQELVLLCMRMVPIEEDKVERFVGGLPDNIQGNVIAAEPSQLQ